MPALNKGKRIRSFFEKEAEAIFSKYLVMETLLPSTRGKGASHKGEEGRYIESLLRDFLNRHLPSDLKAMSGFIIRPSTKTGSDNLSRVLKYEDEHSKQLDVIIYDIARYPVYERFEEFCIVPPEGVVGIISVKKTLRKHDLRNELQSLQEAVSLCRNGQKWDPYSGIFSFQSEAKDIRAKDYFEIIEKENIGKPFSLMINEVNIWNQFVIFKFRETDSPLGSSRYVEVNCKGKKHIGLQRILQSIMGVYYNSERNSSLARPGFVSFEKGTFGNAPVLGDIKTTSK